MDLKQVYIVSVTGWEVRLTQLCNGEITDKWDSNAAAYCYTWWESMSIEGTVGRTKSEIRNHSV